MKVGAKSAELVPLTYNLAKRSAVEIFSQRTHPIDSIGPKNFILEHFQPFCYCTKNGAKPAELVQLTHMFAKQSCVRIFHN
jgi:hypothetical protein